MIVKKLTQAPDGSYTFDGDISSEELTYFLNLGLHTILEAGADCLSGEDDEDLDIPEGTALQ